MKVTLTVTIEKISNGYVLRDEASGVATHVAYDFGLARELEAIAGKAIRAQLADGAPMQQRDEG